MAVYSDRSLRPLRAFRVTQTATRGLHALDFQLHHVIHQHRLVREEGLPVPSTDEGSVMAALGLHQRVEVLAGGKDLAGSTGAVELACIAADGCHFPLELRAHVHHEGRLDRILAVRQCVENLVRAVRLGRWLAVVGICVTLSASIAVGFYELLLRLEG